MHERLHETELLAVALGELTNRSVENGAEAPAELVTKRRLDTPEPGERSVALSVNSTERLRVLEAPSLIVTLPVGALLSIFIVREFLSSTFPALSVA